MITTNGVGEKGLWDTTRAAKQLERRSEGEIENPKVCIAEEEGSFKHEQRQTAVRTSVFHPQPDNP